MTARTPPADMHVDRTTSDAATLTAGTGDDPLGLLAAIAGIGAGPDADSGPADIGPGGVSRRASDAVALRLESSLRGVNDATAARLALSLLARGHAELRGLDALTAEIMAHHGVEPLVMAWMATLATGIATLQGDSVPASLDLVTNHDSADCRTMVMLAPGLFWYAQGEMVARRLPATAVAAMEGAALREIVGHPVLDGVDATIVAVQDGEPVILELDLPRAATCTPDMLLGPAFRVGTGRTTA